MSALPPEADIRRRIENVRYVPEADIYLDNVIGQLVEVALLLVQGHLSRPVF
jgi:hypothetical protein